MKKKFKHIVCSEETEIKFDKLKKYPRETDEEVLIRLIKQEVEK